MYRHIGHVCLVCDPKGKGQADKSCYTKTPPNFPKSFWEGVVCYEILLDDIQNEQVYIKFIDCAEKLMVHNLGPLYQIPSRKSLGKDPANPGNPWVCEI